MQTTTQTRRPHRTASPARWQDAAKRAVADQVQVRQLSGSGQWIATSGSDARTAYELDVTGSIAHGCTCLAGLNNDPVCKHRAAWYLSIGALSLDPEPDPPAPMVQFIHRDADRYDVVVGDQVYGHAVAHPQGHWELYQGLGSKAILRYCGERDAIARRLLAA